MSDFIQNHVQIPGNGCLMRKLAKVVEPTEEMYRAARDYPQLEVSQHVDVAGRVNIENIGYIIDNKEEQEFILGPGIGGKPLGLFNMTKPKFLEAPLSNGRIITMIHTVPGNYRQNAVFLANDYDAKFIMKMMDGDGRALVKTGLTTTDPDRLLGYPFHTCEWVLNGFMLFGDIASFMEIEGWPEMVMQMKFHNMLSARKRVLTRRVEEHTEAVTLVKFEDVETGRG